MKTEQKEKFIALINAELDKAESKHPKFCDDFTGAREWFIVDELERWRKVNSGAPYHADAILNEEILEALEAYKQGRPEALPARTLTMRRGNTPHDAVRA